MRLRVSLVVTSMLALAVVRCSSFTEDNFVPSGDGGVETSTDGPTVDAAADVGRGDCGAVLATDPRNCGRCGHDCLGGDCKSGACQPFVIAGGLTAPGELALADSRIYWETGNGRRTIVSCPRSGCGGAGPALVLADLPDVRSLLVVGETLFFATYDSTPAVSALEACDLPSCVPRRAVEPPVTNIFYVFTPLRRAQGAAYWGKLVLDSGEIRRVVVDAGAAAGSIARTGCLPDRISVGATDVVWTCMGGSTVRHCALPCAVDGGAELVDAGAPTEQLERGGSYVVWDSESGATLRILDEALRSTRDLPSRGSGPLTLVGDDLVFQDGLVGHIDVCRLPACVSKTTLALTTATTLVADERAVFWTVPAQGVVMSVAR